MGIRFRCHHCQHPMHVKDFQAGKKSRCTECQTRFRIPLADAEVSLPIVGDDMATVQALDNETSEINRPAAPANMANGKNESLWSQSTPQATPRAIAEAPKATWFVRPPSGGQYGPAAGEMLVEWIGQRRVTGDSLVWREGMAEWVLASTVLPELFPSNKPIAPPPPPPSSALPPTPPSSTATLVPSDPVLGPVLGTDLNSIGLSSVATNPIQQKLLLKQKKKKEQQRKMITILAVAALVMLVVLIIVVIWNPMGGTVEPPPTQTPTP